MICWTPDFLDSAEPLFSHSCLFSFFVWVETNTQTR